MANARFRQSGGAATLRFMDRDDEPLLDDPFATFDEWASEADARAYAALAETAEE